MSKGKQRIPEIESQDGYRQLICAIVARAVDDAQGRIGANHGDVHQIQAEARQWLEDETELCALLELSGFSPEPVLTRVRRLLSPTEGACV